MYMYIVMVLDWKLKGESYAKR